MFWYGILAFGVFLLHDLNCKSHNNERLLSLFPVGAGLLGLSILSQAQGGQAALPAAVRIIMGVLALFFLVLLVYTVFFAVQPKKQDRKKQASRPWWETPLVDTGVYALCRHPGVWWLCLMCLCLVPSTGFPLSSAVIYTLLDLILVWYEDRYIFPHLIPGYEQYKKTTPFLFPNRTSARRCRETWRKKR